MVAWYSKGFLPVFKNKSIEKGSRQDRKISWAAFGFNETDKRLSWMTEAQVTSIEMKKKISDRRNLHNNLVIDWLKINKKNQMILVITKFQALP